MVTTAVASQSRTQNQPESQQAVDTSKEAFVGQKLEPGQVLVKHLNTEVRVATPADIAKVVALSEKEYLPVNHPDYGKFGALPQPISAESIELKSQLEGATLIVCEATDKAGNKHVAGYTLLLHGDFLVKRDDPEWFAEIQKGIKRTEALEESGLIKKDQAFMSAEDYGIGPRTACYDEVLVGKEFRGQGLGQALFLGISKVCEAKGKTFLFSEVHRETTSLDDNGMFVAVTDPNPNRVSIDFQTQGLGFRESTVRDRSLVGQQEIFKDPKTGGYLPQEQGGQSETVGIQWSRLYKNLSKKGTAALEETLKHKEAKMNVAGAMSFDEIAGKVASGQEPYLTKALINQFVVTKDPKILEVAGISIGGHLTNEFEITANQQAIKYADITLREVLRKGGLSPELRTQVRSVLSAATSCRLDKHSGISKPRGLIEKNFLDQSDYKKIRTEKSFLAKLEQLKTEFDAENRSTQKARIGAKICGLYYANKKMMMQKVPQSDGTSVRKYPDAFSSYLEVIEDVMIKGFKSKNPDMQRMAGYALGHYEGTLDETNTAMPNLLAALSNPKVPAWAVQQLLVWAEADQRTALQKRVEKGEPIFANKTAEAAFLADQKKIRVESSSDTAQTPIDGTVHVTDPNRTSSAASEAAGAASEKLGSNTLAEASESLNLFQKFSNVVRGMMTEGPITYLRRVAKEAQQKAQLEMYAKVVDAGSAQYRDIDEKVFLEKGSVQFTFKSVEAIQNFTKLGGAKIYPVNASGGKSLDGYAVMLTGDCYYAAGPSAFVNFAYGTDKWNEKGIDPKSPRGIEAKKLHDEAPQGYVFIPRECMEVGLTPSGRVDGWLAFSRNTNAGSRLESDSQTSSWLSRVLARAKATPVNTPEGVKTLGYVYSELVDANSAYKEILSSTGMTPMDYDNNFGNLVNPKTGAVRNVEWKIYEMDI